MGACFASNIGSPNRIQDAVEVLQKVQRIGIVVRKCVVHIERDDGHFVGDGGVKLEDDPRPRENRLGLQDDQHLGVLDVVEEQAQV